MGWVFVGDTELKVEGGAEAWLPLLVGSMVGYDRHGGAVRPCSAKKYRAELDLKFAPQRREAVKYVNCSIY